MKLPGEAREGHKGSGWKYEVHPRAWALSGRDPWYYQSIQDKTAIVRLGLQDIHGPSTGSPKVRLRSARAKSTEASISRHLQYLRQANLGASDCEVYGKMLQREDSSHPIMKTSSRTPLLEKWSGMLTNQFFSTEGDKRPGTRVCPLSPPVTGANYTCRYSCIRAILGCSAPMSVIGFLRILRARTVLGNGL